MNQNQSLHPNLARVAAAYDDIVLRFSRGEINAAEARGQVLAQAARDDNGTIWSIDPVTAQWRYETINGRLEYADPPKMGYRTSTGFDVTRDPVAYNPDRSISFYAQDESLLYSPGTLAGATRRPEVNAKKKSSALGKVQAILDTPRKKVIAGVAALVLVVGGVSLAAGVGGDEEPTSPAGVSAPVQ